MFDEFRELNEVEREEFKEAFDYQYVENFLKKMFVEIMKLVAHIEYKKVERARDFGIHVDIYFRQIYDLINNRIKIEEMAVGGIKNDETREEMRKKIMTLKDVKKDLQKLKKDYKRIAKETETQIIEASQDTKFLHKVEQIVREEVTEWKKNHQLVQWILDMGEDNFIKRTAHQFVRIYLYPTEDFIRNQMRKKLNHTVRN